MPAGSLTVSSGLFNSTSSPFSAPQGDHPGVQFVNQAAIALASAVERFSRSSSTGVAFLEGLVSSRRAAGVAAPRSSL